MNKFIVSLLAAISLSTTFGCEDYTAISPIGRSCQVDDQCGAWQGYWVSCVQGTCQMESKEDSLVTEEVKVSDTKTETAVHDVNPGCTDNSECDNDVFCDGTEGCVAGKCVQIGIPPCGIGRVAEDFCNEKYGECGSCQNQGEAWCDDGIDFTTETCNRLVEGAPQCVYTITAGWCYIDQQPYQQDEVNPDDLCQVCDHQSDQYGWTTVPNCPPDTDVIDPIDIIDTDDTTDTSELPFDAPETGEDTEDTLNEDSVEIIEFIDTLDPEEIVDPEDIPELPELEVEEPVDTGIDAEEVVVIDLCQEVECDDNEPCTDDHCNPNTGLCETTNNQEPCNDANFCTEGDLCNDGDCVPGTNLCECQSNEDCVVFEDENLCNGTLICQAQFCVPDTETVIFCDPAENGACFTNSCVPELGTCLIINTEDHLPCTDGNACTQGDYCENGLCTGKQRDCGDNNSCTLDSCDAQVGCRYENNPDVCTDGNACTQGDYCSLGTCLPGENPLECNDNNPCTVDVCSADIGCTYSPKNCTDNNVCTTDACTPETDCTYAPTICSDDNECTVDTCITQQDIGCTFIPQDNAIPCSDDDVCTLDDVCNKQDCLGTPLNCDDANPCTIDACDPSTGCSHIPENILCDDGVQCTVDVCDSIQGCIITADNSVCNDDDVCTTDTCSFTTDCQFVFADKDGDATCDANDFDDDNDGVNDDVDNCPNVSNADQFDDDEDDVGDVCDTELSCDAFTGGAAYAQVFPSGMSDQAKAQKCLGACLKKQTRELVCVFMARPNEMFCYSDHYDGDGYPEGKADCDSNQSGISCQCWPNGICPPPCADLGWTVEGFTAP